MAPDDFEQQLDATLARNRELEEQRAQEVAELRRREQEQREAAEQQRRDAEQARHDRHADLVSHLDALVAQLESAAPEQVVARTGWSESGQEYIAEIASVQLEPKRTLLVELDRDDDEVLARWTSDIGSSVEMWRLLEFGPAELSGLVLQVLDQAAWQGDRPPPFPGH